MLFHGVLQNYSRVHKQSTKPESNSQEVIVIIECYKEFHLYDKFLLSWAYSRVRSNREEDTMQTKRILVSLRRKDFYIAFCDFEHGSGYHVWYKGNVMMSDVVFHVLDHRWMEHGSNNDAW